MGIFEQITVTKIFGVKRAHCETHSSFLSAALLSLMTNGQLLASGTRVLAVCRRLVLAS